MKRGRPSEETRRELMVEEERLFFEIVTKLLQKNVRYLGLLNPSLSRPKLCYLLNNLNNKELKEIEEILNLGTGKRTIVQEIFSFLCPPPYPTKTEQADFDQAWINTIQAIIHSNLPKRFISYLNRKTDKHLLEEKLSQEEYGDTSLFLQLVGQSTSNKEGNVQLVMKYLRPKPKNRRKLKKKPVAAKIKEENVEEKIASEVIQVKEENVEEKIVDGDASEVIQLKEENVEEKIVDGDVSGVVQVKEKNVEENLVDGDRIELKGKWKELWDGFKREKVEDIEGSIKEDMVRLGHNKKIIDDKMKEIEKKIKEIEQINTSINQNRSELDKRNFTLGLLKKKFHTYVICGFVHPFDFKGEYAYLEHHPNPDV